MLPGAENRSVIARHSVPETIAVILAGLWLLGLVSSQMMGGFVHVLLVIAAVVVMVRVIQEEALEPSDFLRTSDDRTE